MFDHECASSALTLRQVAQAQRRAQLLHKIQVEEAISAASVRMYETAKVLKDKKLIADVKTRMDESKQKLQLLNLALSRLPPGMHLVNDMRTRYQRSNSRRGRGPNQGYRG